MKSGKNFGDKLQTVKCLFILSVNIFGKRNPNYYRNTVLEMM